MIVCLFRESKPYAGNLRAPSFQADDRACLCQPAVACYSDEVKIRFYLNDQAERTMALWSESRQAYLVADSVLILNVIVLLGILAGFKATLTLPGIAGIVLVIGMAVDANVLIFERIREELRLGKPPRAAIDAGYAKAFVTILDSNVTTLIAALFLFAFGTGPVKGFALTLSIGIVVSMFTAVFVTRIIFDYFIWNRSISKISI